jgi:hypothetical protein
MYGHSCNSGRPLIRDCCAGHQLSGVTVSLADCYLPLLLLQQRSVCTVPRVAAEPDCPRLPRTCAGLVERLPRYFSASNEPTFACIAVPRETLSLCFKKRELARARSQPLSRNSCAVRRSRSIRALQRSRRRRHIQHRRPRS